jgi:hypothetical protein
MKTKDKYKKSRDPASGSLLSPPSPKKPLDQIQLLALLAGGISTRQSTMLANEQGISFEPTEDCLPVLKSAGAAETTSCRPCRQRSTPNPTLFLPESGPRVRRC